MMLFCGLKTTVSVKNIIKVDCQHVSTDLFQKKEDMLVIGSIINSCKNLLASQPNYMAFYIQRQTNLVAHELARRVQICCGRVVQCFE